MIARDPSDGYETQVESAGEDVVCYEAEGEVYEGLEFRCRENVGCLLEWHGWEEEVRGPRRGHESVRCLLWVMLAVRMRFEGCGLLAGMVWM